MTNDKEEFLEKFKRGIRDVSVGQYNDKYINIGYKPLYEEMWNWIESKLKAKDEEIERLSKQNESFQEVYYRLITQLTNEIEGTTK